MSALVVALLQQAAHEKHQADLWRRVSRFLGVGSCGAETAETWARECDDRAQIYNDWAVALTHGVTVDFIRYGTERRNLA